MARCYALEFTKEDIPWAFARGDLFRSVASLELLATLLCIMVCDPRQACLTRGVLSLTVGGATKFPLYLILSELAVQIRKRNFVLWVA